MSSPNLDGSMDDYAPAPVDLSRLNARIAETRMPIAIWATVAGLTVEQASAIVEGKSPPTRQQVAKIAAAINISPAYLMGAATPEVPKPPTANPVVNPADVARVQAAKKAMAEQSPEPPSAQAPEIGPEEIARQLESADPISANLLEALEIALKADAFDYETVLDASESFVNLPASLYQFGLRNDVPLSVLVAVDRIASMLSPRFTPRGQSQWAEFYSAAVPLAKAVVRISVENNESFFRE